MQYRNLVKRAAHYSGFSDQESETVLWLCAEALTARLNDSERTDFAGQLQSIDRGRAKKQIMASWLALKDALSPGEPRHFKAQLPNDLVTELH